MAKITKDTLFKAEKPRAETLIDKTTRAAWEILDDEAEKRETKTARLRKARLEREASTVTKAPQAQIKDAAQKTRVKADGKS
ncbi:hypothetical protein TG4357_01903 [Thalassovita gelatinovora]|uniref:Uncharacterized protein n=1 Tax=Thalassovita gelatinovora TaxID=53501 RepID=A0A0P1FBB8_THAGE|nr:hypothetical protein [Thalassovita gelatinovora]QIZ80084.1 hypothetical protein HFZ77_06140 [Thalassovita gelatinovora]CUH65507.1 hypothetical protein TG4357_01903 [Thalassovita gelatinovora]SER08531.1 hypothetical protein SAMN04488043_11547 [Thalassovita gelatinovora]